MQVFWTFMYTKIQCVCVWEIEKKDRVSVEIQYVCISDKFLSSLYAKEVFNFCMFAQNNDSCNNFHLISFILFEMTFTKNYPIELIVFNQCKNSCSTETVLDNRSYFTIGLSIIKRWIKPETTDLFKNGALLHSKSILNIFFYCLLELQNKPQKYSLTPFLLNRISYYLNFWLQLQMLCMKIVHSKYQNGHLLLHQCTYVRILCH